MCLSPYLNIDGDDLHCPLSCDSIDGTNCSIISNPFYVKNICTAIFSSWCFHIDDFQSAPGPVALPVCKGRKWMLPVSTSLPFWVQMPHPAPAQSFPRQLIMVSGTPSESLPAYITPASSEEHTGDPAELKGLRQCGTSVFSKSIASTCCYQPWQAS